MHGFEDMRPDYFFKLRKSDRLRGNSLSIEKPKTRLDVRKYSFSNGVVSACNRLSEDVVQSQSVNLFKNKLDLCKVFIKDT